ncbi:protease complex subunit PrcB family protein [uncultured Planktosalinus sp.]|uniref:protease complex subunit PrcB family protein n=1 Tax=uncultured Planktosalinus sp. TaxID=1810935 RepID=UPI0030DCC0F6
MKYATILIVALFLSNCDGTKKTQERDPDASFNIIHQAAYGGKDSESFDIIKSKQALFEQIKLVGLESQFAQKLNDIDFNVKTVLVLHAGSYNTGGYSIGVSNVEVNGTTSYVTVEETSPEPGEPVTMALTNPYCIAVIDSNETIVFK